MLIHIKRAPWVLALGTVFALTGCGGLIKDRSGDYLKSDEIPPISLPEGVDSSAIGQVYVIPPISNTEVDPGSSSVPRPLPVSETRFEETVKIQSYEDKRWILINKPPEEVWPRVRNILSRNGIPTTNVDAVTGVMETSWVQFKDDEENSHRFHLSIEPAVQLNSTEVKMVHMQSLSGTEVDGLAWPASSQDSGREQQMLEIVANMMASDISSGTVSLLAQSIGGEAKVEMVTPQVADPYLQIRLNYDRSWVSVLYSLSRGGFSITDQNKTAGTVYVDFLDVDEEQDKPGFFSRWFGGDDEPQRDAYQVLIKSVERGVEVRIVGADKQSLESGLSATLLKVIRGNLS